MRIWRLSAAVLLTAALVATGIFVSGVVLASHNFSDVPTGAFYHNAVEWVFNRGITAGCAVGLYCPDNNVTRGQMAVFLQKTGMALTPEYQAAQELGALDPDLNPVICQTASYTPIGYSRFAVVDSQLGINAPGTIAYSIKNVYSTDGGATWFQLGLGLAETVASGEYRSTSVRGWVLLNAGTTYKLGLQIGRLSGTADITNSWCELYLIRFNWNGFASPLRPGR